MSRPRRAAVAVAAVVVLLGVVGVLAWRASSDAVDDPDGAGSPTALGTQGVVVDATPAARPFEASTAGTIRVGDRELVVVVADSDGERSTGLRGRTGPAPYAGMLFVFDGDTRAAFTMAGVPAALDIAFYATDGTRVDTLRMEPCAGTDATCPTYQPGEAFRYALETAPGALPSGSLRVR